MANEEKLVSVLYRSSVKSAFTMSSLNKYYSFRNGAVPILMVVSKFIKQNYFPAHYYYNLFGRHQLKKLIAIPALTPIYPNYVRDG